MVASCAQIALKLGARFLKSYQMIASFMTLRKKILHPGRTRRASSRITITFGMEGEGICCTKENRRRLSYLNTFSLSALHDGVVNCSWVLPHGHRQAKMSSALNPSKSLHDARLLEEPEPLKMGLVLDNLLQPRSNVWDLNQMVSRFIRKRVSSFIPRLTSVSWNVVPLKFIVLLLQPMDQCLLQTLLVKMMIGHPHPSSCVASNMCIKAEV